MATAKKSTAKKSVARKSPAKTPSASPGNGGSEHTLKLTNLDKVLFPARRPHPAVTKRDLIRHNATMAPAMLPSATGPLEHRRHRSATGEIR